MYKQGFSVAFKETVAFKVSPLFHHFHCANLRGNAEC